jgi:glycosyltransferase involved in cell wall biosynthesis
MKIAYINFILSESVLGLDKKIREQSRRAPDNIDFYLLNRFKDHKHNRINFVKIKGKILPYNYIFRKFNLIERSISQKRYNYVVLRYPFADKSCLRFARKYNVISEHHSYEIHELKANLINRSSAKIKLISLVRLFLEYKYGTRYREQCKGIIAVTDEIRRKEVAKLKEDLPTITISNGVDVDTIKMTSYRPLKTRNLSMIFVASNLLPWHGLKRILTSIKKYEGAYDITVHLVGDMKPSTVNLLGKGKTIYHGIKDGIELDEIYSKCNIAISTMELYLKNLKEAASLKTREYTARGIPFILAYDDPDLAEVEEQRKFFLKFPNDKEIVDIDIMISFLAEIAKRYNEPEELSRYMREYAFHKLDWGVKMKKYVEFCSQV